MKEPTQVFKLWGVKSSLFNFKNGYNVITVSPLELLEILMHPTHGTPCA